MAQLHTPEEIAAILWNDIVKDGKCVVWIGSGLSRPMYPDWQETVETLCEACGINIPTCWVASKPGPEKLIIKAEECKISAPEAYQSQLGVIFGRDVSETRIDYSYLLTTSHIRGYITTNFDRLLQVHAQLHRVQSVQAYPKLMVGVLGARTHPCFYLHGLAYRDNQPDGSSLVFSSSEFEEAYKPEAGIAGLVAKQVIMEYPILFLGCDLEDEYTYEVFTRVHEIQKQILSYDAEYIPPQRYVVRKYIPKKARKYDQENRRKYSDSDSRYGDLNIEVLRYRAEEHRPYQGITDCLRVLSEISQEHGENTPLDMGVPA